MSDAVLLSIRDHVATLALNRPDNRNAMTVELLDAFKAKTEELRQNSQIRVLIVTGSGSCFCSGADFNTTQQLLTRSGFAGQAGTKESARLIYGSFLSLLDLDIPVIAAVNGHAIGGGLGLALACDLRIASRTAKLAANFVRLGLHPGMAISYVLPRLVGVPKAAELLFTGRTVTGEEAEKIGLVGQAVEANEVLPAAEKLAAEIAACAPYAVRMTKRSLYNGLGFDPKSQLETEAFAQALCSQMEDAREGVMALMQKRDPVFKGK